MVTNTYCLEGCLMVTYVRPHVDGMAQYDPLLAKEVVPSWKTIRTCAPCESPTLESAQFGAPGRSRIQRDPLGVFRVFTSEA